MALDGGVNWIDTAPMYGQGKSEEAIGWLLKEINEDPIVSTKVNLDMTRLNDIAGQVEESLTTSLQLLDRDAVDVVHLHNCITPTTGGS
jgi:L-galactose dehydrogenase